MEEDVDLTFIFRLYVSKSNIQPYVSCTVDLIKLYILTLLSSNDVKSIYKFCQEREILFHSDCVQAAGVNPIDMNEIADLVSISGHKIYEPKPIVKNETKVEPKNQKRFRTDVYDTSPISDEEFDWEKVRQNITESFSEIIAYKEKLSSQLNHIEAELCDCEHACEFFKCDAAHGYKLYAMIRERRIKRRFLKDELWKANSVLGMSYSDIANGGIESAFKEIGEQTYEPRVLKELFSDALQTATISK